jgi:hypothetical protein
MSFRLYSLNAFCRLAECQGVFFSILSLALGPLFFVHDEPVCCLLRVMLVNQTVN